MKYWSLGYIVDFETVCHVSDAFPGVLILICDEANLVPPFNKTLGKLITVGFYATEFRKCKICANEYLVALIEFSRDI